MKKLSLLLLISVLQVSTWSQEASITISDGKTDELLPYVNVCFESIKNGAKEYLVTDLNGQVTNTCFEKCIVAISFVGYKTLYDTILPKQTKVFKLDQDIFNLEQITVTGTRTEKHLKDAPIITQVITAKDIELRGLRSVKDVLEDDMSGIEFKQAGYGSDIRIQGLDANYVLFLIDGERMAGASNGNVDYSRLNTANIERIEIIKGAASSLYGSQAMAGVINIITKTPRKKIELSVGSQFKQFNKINYPDLNPTDEDFIYKQNLDRPNLNNNVSLGLNFGKISSLTDFVIKSSDAYQLYDKDSAIIKYSNIDSTTYRPIGISSIDGFEDYSISQKIKFKLSDKFSATIKASYYNHNQYDFIKNNAYKKFIDYTYGGNITYSFNETSSLLASFNSDTYEKYNKSEKTSSKLKISSHQFINPRLLFNTKFNKHAVTMGAEYLNESLMSDKFTFDTIVKKDAQTYISFIQDDINFTEKLNFIAGLRTDYHSAFGFHASPKVSAMYKIKPFTFRANYANGFRAPNLKELYMDWDHLGLFVIQGNENLKPETNNYFSLSTEFTKKKLNTSLTIFHNRFKNKIEGQWTSKQTVYQYINVNESEISGAELTLRYRILNNISLSGGYSYLYNKTKVDGMRISTASPHSGNSRLEYKLRKGFYNLTLNLTGKIYGAKDFDESELVEYNGEEITGIYSVHYDAYSEWKFTITQNFYNGINLILGVDNIFDYTADIVTFNTSIAPGRRFFVSLNFSFDKLYESWRN